MLVDLINITKLKRTLLYLAALLVCLLLQNTIFSRISILGVRPMFVPCFVVAVAVFSGASWGGAFGLIAGILLDIKFVESVVLFTVFMPILGFVSGVVMENFLNKRFFSYFCFCAAALALCAMLQCMRLLFFSHTGELASIAAAQTSGGSGAVAFGVSRGKILLVALMQTVWSLPFSFLIFYPCRAIGLYNKS